MPNLPSFQNVWPMRAVCRANRATLTAWVHTSPNQILLAEFQTTSHANGQDFCNSKPNSRHSGLECSGVAYYLHAISQVFSRTHETAPLGNCIRGHRENVTILTKIVVFLCLVEFRLILDFCCVFFADEIQFCGDLKPSSNTVATRLYQNKFSALVSRHFRPIIELAWVISRIRVSLGDISTSVLQTLVWVLRSQRPIIEAVGSTEQLVVYKRPYPTMLPSFMRIGALEIPFLGL